MYSVTVCSISIVVYSFVFTSDAADSSWFLQILASVLHGNVQFPLTLNCNSVARIQENVNDLDHHISIFGTHSLNDTEFNFVPQLAYGYKACSPHAQSHTHTQSRDKSALAHKTHDSLYVKLRPRCIEPGRAQTQTLFYCLFLYVKYHKLSNLIYN